MKRLILLSICTLLLAMQANAQTTRYVKTDGPTSADNAVDATTWADACSDLQAVINASSAGDRIWVAAGTYTPNRPANNLTTINASNRDNAFVLKAGVQIYGSFAGTETALTARNWQTNVTTLSGDIGTAGSNADNCYHIVVGVNIADDGETVLDGFTITDANANNTTDRSITIDGHAIYRDYGAGIYNYASHPVLNNMIISNNTADNGGGIFNHLSSPKLNNVLIEQNTVRQLGGGMYNYDQAHAVLTNITVSRNTATSGGGIYNSDSSPKIYNSIIYGNTNNNNVGNINATPVYGYSLVGGLTGSGIIANTDPMFTDAAGGDYRLLINSPAIDAGSNQLYLDARGITDFNQESDLAGNQRLNGDNIDLGAYEYYPPKRLYVKKGGAGNEDGSSWENALAELADALNTAITDDFGEIWVAEGVYHPLYKAAETDDKGQQTTDRDKAFILVDGLKIYGGFAGSEISIDQRDWTNNPTVLSGDIGVADDASDNCYHVVISAGDVGEACLDGLIVTGGKSDDADDSHITVNEKDIYRKAGGGVHNTDASPEITNVIIKNNTANDGGGIYNTGSSPAITNVIIHNNTADFGGGMANASSFPVLTNVTIAHNSANTIGGGMLNSESSPKIRNSIIFGNGNNVFNDNSTPVYANSLVEGETLGNGIILNSDPLFTDAGNGDYSLASNSPCINKGDNAYFDAGNTPDLSHITTDFAGNNRIAKRTVDLGAFEFSITITPDAAGIVYVNKGVTTGTGSGDSWYNAVPELADALEYAGSNPAAGIKEIWAAKGVYTPLYQYSYFRTDERDNTFMLAPNVNLHGGFAGTETTLEERILPTVGTAENGSVLSGKTGNDSVYHVLLALGDIGNVTISGFTITGGSSTATEDNVTVYQQNYSGTDYYSTYPYYGGGLYAAVKSGNTLTFRNCDITGNRASMNGGGVYNAGEGAMYVFTSNVSNNVAANGGGLSIGAGVAAKIHRCIFDGNKATALGGAIQAGTITAVSSLFTNNEAGNGGAFDFASFESYLVNLTITGNKATTAGGGVHVREGSISLYNSILYNNTAPLNGNVNVAAGSISVGACALNDAALPPSGASTRGYNLFGISNPFVGDSDYRLKKESACVNIGDNRLYSSTPGIYGFEDGLDLPGNRRTVNGLVDIGAFESEKMLIMPDEQGIIYVNKHVTGGDSTGRNWENATPELADALEHARTYPQNINEIWVAKGTYNPLYNPLSNTGEDKSDNAFMLVKNINLHGGFEGNETTLEERILPDTGAGENGSVLSGNMGGYSVYHILVAASDIGNVTVSGFTFTGGNANGSGSADAAVGYAIERNGGGALFIYTNNNSELRLQNCTFTGNNAAYGGAIYNEVGSQTVVDRCIFDSNAVTDNGGAIYNYAANIDILDTKVSNNSATREGGGFFNGRVASQAFVSGCIFTGNTAGNLGGGIHSTGAFTAVNSLLDNNECTTGSGGAFDFYGNATLVNLTIADNTAAVAGSGINVRSGTINLQNSILHNNENDNIIFVSNANAKVVNMDYCALNDATLPAGVTAGEGNLLAIDPLFTNAANGDYSLQSGSACIDAGNNAYVTATVDLAGNPRFRNTIVDLGAYESAPVHTVTFNSNGGTEIPAVQALDGATIDAPETPVKEGYIFTDWYKESELINVWNFETDVITENITLYADWDISTGIPEADAATITVYPNPTHGKLTIDSGQLTIEKVEIFDLQGKKLSIINCQSSITEVDISHFAEGVYIIQVNEKRVKVVKMR